MSNEKSEKKNLKSAIKEKVFLNELLIEVHKIL